MKKKMCLVLLDISKAFIKIASFLNQRAVIWIERSTKILEKVKRMV